MTPKTVAVLLLARLRTAGFTLTAAGAVLWVEPASKLTPELRTAIRASREYLLDLLWFEVPFADAPWLRRWGEEYDERPAAQEEDDADA